MASPDYKLEHTTKSGIKCYVREITLEVARSITENSPDHPFLAEGEKPYLFVVVHNGKVIDLAADETGLSIEQGLEIAAWSMKKTMAEDAEMQKMLQEAGKKK